MWANTWMGASTGLLSVGLDENVYIKNSNFGPKLDAENSEKIGFGGTEGSQIGV